MYSKHGVIGMVAWLIVALAALNIGLAETGYFDFNNLGFMAHDHMRMIVHYVVGLAGLLSLVGFFLHCYRCASGDECSMQKPHHR